MLVLLSSHFISMGQLLMLILLIRLSRVVRTEWTTAGNEPKHVYSNIYALRSDLTLLKADAR